MHQAVSFEKMLAFLREGVDFVDTLKCPLHSERAFFRISMIPG